MSSMYDVSQYMSVTKPSIHVAYEQADLFYISVCRHGFLEPITGYIISWDLLFGWCFARLFASSYISFCVHVPSSNVKAQIEAEDISIMQQLRPDDWVWPGYLFISRPFTLHENILSSLIYFMIIVCFLNKIDCKTYLC